MKDLNQVFLSGRLTQDPVTKMIGTRRFVSHIGRDGRCELGFDVKQTVVSEFGLAINRRFTDAQDNPREEVCFVDVTAFGRQAELIDRYFHKGKPIAIAGRLRFSEWDDADTGARRTKLSVVLERFRFVDRKSFLGRLMDRDFLRVLGLAAFTTIALWMGGVLG